MNIGDQVRVLSGGSKDLHGRLGIVVETSSVTSPWPIRVSFPDTAKHAHERYHANELLLISNPEIKIGDKVRVTSYDDHPRSGGAGWNGTEGVVTQHAAPWKNRPTVRIEVTKTRDDEKNFHVGGGLVFPTDTLSLIPISELQRHRFAIGDRVRVTTGGSLGRTGVVDKTNPGASLSVRVHFDDAVRPNFSLWYAVNEITHDLKPIVQKVFGEDLDPTDTASHFVRSVVRAFNKNGYRVVKTGPPGTGAGALNDSITWTVADGMRDGLGRPILVVTDEVKP